jgi:hypothetical protein
MRETERNQAFELIAPVLTLARDYSSNKVTGAGRRWGRVLGGGGADYG